MSVGTTEVVAVSRKAIPREGLRLRVGSALAARRVRAALRERGLRGDLWLDFLGVWWVVVWAKSEERAARAVINEIEGETV
jgi:hypothetical protein